MSSRVRARCFGLVGLLLFAACSTDCSGTNASSKLAPPVITAPEAGPPPLPAAPAGAAHNAPACPGADQPTGSVYYVCDCARGAAAGCRAGNDRNDGRHGDKPFQSYQRAREQFSRLKPGETVAFCRGGAFSIEPDSEQRWVNASCRADRPCVVRDYRPTWGRASDGPPIIRAPAEGRVFSLDNGGDAEHEEGYLFANLDLEGSGSGWAVFLYNDIDDVTMCNLTINDFGIGVHLGGSNTPKPGSDAKNERITLRASRITNNGGQGWLGSSSGTVIEGNHFDNNGFEKAIYNHNIYLSGADDDDVRVTGNELTRSAIVDGKCQGTSLVVHGRITNLRIEDNLIREDMGAVADTCWGIGVVTGYKTPEAFRNVVVARNTIVNVGNVSIALNACHDCVVENNVIVNEQNDNEAAISIPAIDREDGDLLDDAITVRYNSIFIDGGTGISLEKEGSRHSVVGNAIHSAGKKPSACFALGLTPQAYRKVDYNVCDPGRDGRWTGAVARLPVWSDQTGFDRHSALADPAFAAVTAPRYDLTPRAGSPLLGRGDPGDRPAADRAGKPRAKGSPNVGALEP